MSYKSPIEDFKYNLAMLNYDEIIAGIDKFKDYDSDTLMSVVSEIGRLNELEVVDSNKIGDREGLKYLPDGPEGPDVKLNLLVKAAPLALMEPLALLELTYRRVDG